MSILLTTRFSSTTPINEPTKEDLDGDVEMLAAELVPDGPDVETAAAQKVKGVFDRTAANINEAGRKMREAGEKAFEESRQNNAFAANNRAKANRITSGYNLRSKEKRIARLNKAENQAAVALQANIQSKVQNGAGTVLEAVSDPVRTAGSVDSVAGDFVGRFVYNIFEESEKSSGSGLVIITKALDDAAAETYERNKHNVAYHLGDTALKRCLPGFKVPSVGCIIAVGDMACKLSDAKSHDERMEILKHSTVGLSENVLEGCLAAGGSAALAGVGASPGVVVIGGAAIGGAGLYAVEKMIREARTPLPNETQEQADSRVIRSFLDSDDGGGGFGLAMQLTAILEGASKEESTAGNPAVAAAALPKNDAPHAAPAKPFAAAPQPDTRQNNANAGKGNPPRVTRSSALKNAPQPTANIITQTGQFMAKAMEGDFNTWNPPQKFPPIPSIFDKVTVVGPRPAKHTLEKPTPQESLRELQNQIERDRKKYQREINRENRILSESGLTMEQRADEFERKAAGYFDAKKNHSHSTVNDHYERTKCQSHGEEYAQRAQLLRNEANAEKLLASDTTKVTGAEAPLEKQAADLKQAAAELRDFAKKMDESSSEATRIAKKHSGFFNRLKFGIKQNKRAARKEEFRTLSAKQKERANACREKAQHFEAEAEKLAHAAREEANKVKTRSQARKQTEAEKKAEEAPAQPKNIPQPKRPSEVEEMEIDQQYKDKIDDYFKGEKQRELRKITRSFTHSFLPKQGEQLAGKGKKRVRAAEETRRILRSKGESGSKIARTYLATGLGNAERAVGGALKGAGREISRLTGQAAKAQAVQMEIDAMGSDPEKAERLNEDAQKLRDALPPLAAMAADNLGVGIVDAALNYDKYDGPLHAVADVSMNAVKSTATQAGMQIAHAGLLGAIAEFSPAVAEKVPGVDVIMKVYTLAQAVKSAKSVDEAMDKVIDVGVDMGIDSTCMGVAQAKIPIPVVGAAVGKLAGTVVKATAGPLMKDDLKSKWLLISNLAKAAIDPFNQQKRDAVLNSLNPVLRIGGITLQKWKELV